MLNCRFLKILIVSILFLLFINHNLYGQVNVDTFNIEKPYVKWMKQYPIPENEKPSKGLIHKVENFFWGKPQIMLNKPMSVLATSSDTLWVLDQGNKNLLRLVDNKLSLPSFSSKQKNSFNSLVGAALKSTNEILFTDSRLNQLFLFNIQKGNISVINGSLKLMQPTGVAYSKSKEEIWVVETAAHRISIIDKNGEITKTIGGRGLNDGQFNFPTFIWIDKSEHVYVVDAMNYRIQIFDTDGKFVNSFGEIGDVSGTFSRPKGVATDSYGNIYVVDALFHVVQLFDRNGKYLYSFGKQGHGKGQFWMPIGIFIDDQNLIYISDSYNSRIQIFQLIDEH